MNLPSSRIHNACAILSMGTHVDFGSLGLARFGAIPSVLPAMQWGSEWTTPRRAPRHRQSRGYLALSVIGGSLAIRYGPRAVITIALLVVGLVCFSRPPHRLTRPPSARTEGVGSGASMSRSWACAAWFTRKRRGMASVLAVAGSSIALIDVGPLVPRIWRIPSRGLAHLLTIFGSPFSF